VGGSEKNGIFWRFQSMRTWRAAERMSGVPPYSRENKEFFFSVFGGEKGKGRTLRRRPVLSASMVKNSIVEENMGRS
jgi:hypothetical protein